MKTIKVAVKFSAFLFLGQIFVNRLNGGSILQQPPVKTIPLPEVIEARYVRVGHDRVYVVDRESIAVYALNDFRFLGRFGRMGQGPGEFTLLEDLTVLPDGLLVKCAFKLHYFSPEGKFERAITIPVRFGPKPVPVGNQYVWFFSDRKEDGSLAPPRGHLCDKNLKPIKDFYGEISGSPPPPPPPGKSTNLLAKKQDVFLIRDFFDVEVADGKIFVADSRKGLMISVFDARGKIVHEIRQEYQKIKVPKGYKDSVSGNSGYWKLNNPVVPEYFPAFFGFKIDSGRIYIITPEQKEDRYEVVVMDLDGKVLRRSYCFPLKPDWWRPEFVNLGFEIHQDTIYWLDFNDPAERFELHLVPVR